MGPGPLCVDCGYWVAEIGSQCEACFDGEPERGRERSVVASAILWRRSLIPNTTTAGYGPTAALRDAVDLLEADSDDLEVTS